MEVNKHMKQKDFYEKMSDWKKQYELKEDKIQTGRFNEYEKRREVQHWQQIVYLQELPFWSLRTKLLCSHIKER